MSATPSKTENTEDMTPARKELLEYWGIPEDGFSYEERKTPTILPPDKYRVRVTAARELASDYVEILFSVTDEPFSESVLSARYDMRYADERGLFGDLLSAAGLPLDAVLTDLEGKEIVAAVKAVAARTRNEITEYRRDPLAGTGEGATP